MRRAFTLIEILAVVVILGVLAAVVISQVGTASETARESAMRDGLRYLRTQTKIYQSVHGLAPGTSDGATSEEAFLNQMTKFVNERGQWADARSTDHRYGPYCSHIPVNPLNGMSSIRLVAEGQPIPEPDDSTGWVYKPETLEFFANSKRAVE